MEVIVGAGLGAVCGELLKLVVQVTKKTIGFKTLLRRIETNLKQIQPLCTQLEESNNPADQETSTTLNDLLKRGTKLVNDCSTITVWNVIARVVHVIKLNDYNNKLWRFFQIDLQTILLGASLKILSNYNVSSAPSRANRFSGACSVPGLPEFIVGLDQHLTELKRRLLKDDTKVVVVSAPGGFGKTTLVKKLCHDDEIKGIFGDNILYVTVSTDTSLKNIAQNLFKHYDIKDFHFVSEEDAKNQIENLIRQKGSGNMLLVLDDVWPESEYVVQDLKFHVPGFKILVTSRSSFPGLDSIYDLSLLDAEDAKTLFRHFAFQSDGIRVNNVPDDLVDKMVESCKGIPLALTVVGASLRGKLEAYWRFTLDKWSKGQSILESHEQLLVCLQTSIDALDELQKKCFLDLGLFPEDDQIAGGTLMDIWTELYKLDDDMEASITLLHLASRNLINLVSFRRAAGEIQGHCSQYRITQHDVLRDLASHLCRQEPAAERKRLFIKIWNNNFPEWWTQQPVDARILSISTDEEFSSTWYDLNAPNVEVLILNVRSENYTLPQFIERMSQLKVLIITGYGVHPTQLENLEVLGSLSKLTRIRFEHVSLSSSVQVIFTLKSLKKLTFVICKIGDAFSYGITAFPYTLENLNVLEIDLCYDLKELPAGLCSSVHLQKLIIKNCQELDALPEDLGNLSNLEILRLHCCTKLKELPESIEILHKLSIMDISNCLSLTAVPEQVGELSSLRVIDISGCEGLAKLPMSLGKSKQLKEVWCDDERYFLWKNIESDLCNVKVNIVEEDRSSTLKKICQ